MIQLIENKNLGENASVHLHHSPISLKICFLCQWPLLEIILLIEVCVLPDMRIGTVSYCFIKEFFLRNSAKYTDMIRTFSPHSLAPSWMLEREASECTQVAEMPQDESTPTPFWYPELRQHNILYTYKRRLS